MLERNKIYCCEVLEGLKMLDNESVDLIITSPPYNLAGFRGTIVNESSKHNIWHKNIKYGGDVNIDNMPEDEYEKWQIDFLNECFRVLKKDGSMFYNHKVRVKKNKISFPLEWIDQSKFITRQIIVWDRSSSMNMDKCRYIPSTEYIFWLIKERKNPRFKRDNNAQFISEVWKFAPDKNNEHPAPFPITLPDNIIPSVAQGERILVLDPFMGSGTVAMSAKKNGCDYIGFDLIQEYVDKANERIEKS
jgi:modification methylase